MISRSRICGARRKALSGLGGMLETVGLEMTTKVSGQVNFQRAGGREFQLKKYVKIHPYVIGFALNA